jgi:flagellar biogenesis protein FliO
MELLRELVGVIVVFGLLWMARRFLRGKTWRSNSAPALLESRGKLVLTARHSVHLIRAGDRILVVGVHPDGITFLGEGATTDPRHAAAIGSAAS